MSYANFVRTTTATPPNVADTTITLVAATAPYNLPPTTGGWLVLADSLANPSVVEVITYTGRTGLVLSGVVRGREGTSARTWTGPVYCYQPITAASLAADLEALKLTIQSLPLTGLNLTNLTAVVNTDTVLAAVGKLQAQQSRTTTLARTPTAATLTYTDGVLTSITETQVEGTKTTTLSYTGGALTSVVTVLNNYTKTDTLTYTAGVLTSTTTSEVYT